MNPPQRKSECELLNVCSIPTAMEVRLRDTHPTLARGLLYAVLHVVYFRRNFVVISTFLGEVFFVQVVYIRSLGELVY